MSVVDLSNLREAIGNDTELEKELFDEFIDSTNSLLVELKKHIEGQNDNEAWRKAAHALKGLAVNLGAEHLGELSKTGQEGCEDAIDTKKSLLDEIEEEHKKVVEFLNTQ